MVELALRGNSFVRMKLTHQLPGATIVVAERAEQVARLALHVITSRSWRSRSATAHTCRDWSAVTVTPRFATSAP